ncbi:MAG: patatin-like phospholipase family protein [Alphaproteobacteria bacterium]
MFKVLSIDGGGIRGVIPGVLLQYLEEEAGRGIAEMFDLMVGTSTGGILATGLSAPKADDKPRYSAAEMLAFYVERGAEIFHRSLWRGITSVGGATDEQYDHRPLERLLKQYLGDATLAECLVPIVVTSYDIERREPYFFKTRRAREKKDRNHYLRDVARATSAAPTFFEPAVVKGMASNTSRRVLVDGGVFVNNPGMCAYVEAYAHGARHEDIIVVSLGTGTATRRIPYDDAKDWGAIGWIRPIISVMMDGAADAADYQLRQILPDSDAGQDQRYFRFDTDLDLALDDMDAANAGNIQALKDEAQQIVEKQGRELERLLRILCG